MGQLQTKLTIAFERKRTFPLDFEGLPREDAEPRPAKMVDWTEEDVLRERRKRIVSELDETVSIIRENVELLHARQRDINDILEDSQRLSVSSLDMHRSSQRSTEEASLVRVLKRGCCFGCCFRGSRAIFFTWCGIYSLVFIVVFILFSGIGN